MPKYLDLDGLSYLWGKITSKFVAKETGKGLSTNDFTTAEKTKLAGIEAGAEANVIENVSVNGVTGTISNKVASVTIATGDTNIIESISVNGTALTPVDKAVDIQTPQYVTNGNSYDIVYVTSGTLNNVSGAYLMYNNGSVDLQSGGFFPDMIGMAYASQQIISTADDNAQTLINGRASSATPIMDGTASVGISDHFSREDHVHPTDTSRQATLVSGTNIKTINGTSILGSGDLTINASSIAYDDSQTQLGNDVQSALETLDQYNSSISQAVTNIRQLPAVTTADNGKVLRVVNGAWAVVSLPSASGVSF